MTTDFYMLIPAVTASLVALITDFRSKRIPNVLTFPAMAVGIIYHILTGDSSMLFRGIGGMLVGLGLFMIPYFMGGMGAGDAKLMGALGAMVGPRGIVNIGLFTAIAGGLYALGVIVLRRESKNLIRNSLTSMVIFAGTKNLSLLSTPLKERMPRLCYAAAIAAGTMFYALLVLSGQEVIL